MWYLPHHPVTHPMKPGKVRIVFDCAAKYHGISLNQQLLQSPDFTNPLVGVLTRFRQETTAIAADIEGVFHQVYFDPKDFGVFRFLWWPDGQLSEQPQEYRMVRHLFGTTSSPSVATVKSVQLHIFSDGSRVGCRAVAFLRFVNACGRIHCIFVMGKARLAPIHEITIPRLELTAAVISVKLSQIIREELETKIDQVNYWTDSMTVLKCINNDTKRFHVFESNRLTIIRSTSSPSEWRYVS